MEKKVRIAENKNQQMLALRIYARRQPVTLANDIQFKVFLANKKGSYYTCKKLANSCLLFYVHKKNCFDKYIV